MNLLDYIILAIFFYFIIKGLFRGFIRELCLLSGVILGLWLANHFHERVADLLNSYIPFFDSFYLSLISFLAILAPVMIIFNIIGWTLKLVFKKVFLGWIDRLFGSGLAVIKGIVIIYMALIILFIYLPSQTPLIAGSTLSPLIVKSYQSIIRSVSPDYYRRWMKRILENRDRVTEAVSEKVKKVIEQHE